MHLSARSLNIGLAVMALVLIGLLLLFGDVPMRGDLWLQAVMRPDSLPGQIVWDIRLPRNVTGFCVGAMLGMSGALMQGLLRNPLAEPGILGVSSGAGLGAALAIVSGLGLTPFAVEGFALAGAVIIAGLLLLFTARFPQRQSLILLGVGVTALCGALMALVFNLSPSPVTTAEILGWTMGSVENRTWGDAGLCLAGLGLASILSWRMASGLRFLTLGDETARSMGIDMARLGQAVILATGILSGLAVAVAGVIGFVGLAAPHFVRGMGIKDPFRLILPSALTGGVMVLIADGLIRLLPASGDIRLGVLTSLIGAPLFAVIAWKSARSWMQD